jgi:hypothetical protein
LVLKNELHSEFDLIHKMFGMGSVKLIHVWPLKCAGGVYVSLKLDEINGFANGLTLFHNVDTNLGNFERNSLRVLESFDGCYAGRIFYS